MAKKRHKPNITIYQEIEIISLLFSFFFSVISFSVVNTENQYFLPLFVSLFKENHIVFRILFFVGILFIIFGLLVIISNVFDDEEEYNDNKYIYLCIGRVLTIIYANHLFVNGDIIFAKVLSVPIFTLGSVMAVIPVVYWKITETIEKKKEEKEKTKRILEKYLNKF